MGSKEELRLTPGEVLTLARNKAAELEALVASLDEQRAEAEASDFGSPILADRLRGQILPGIGRNLDEAQGKLRRIRDHFIPKVERALAENPHEKMSLCDSQCYGETQHCVYCHF